MASRSLHRILLVTLAACGHAGEPKRAATTEPAPAPVTEAEPPAAAAATAPASDCPARAAKVGAFLTAMDHDAMWFDVTGYALPQRSDVGEANDPRGPYLRIRPGSVELLGDVGVGLRELTERLRAQHDRLAATAPETPVFLVVDGATPWRELAPVLDAVRAGGFERVRFVFARVPKSGPPPRTALDDEIDAVIASRPSSLADAFGSIVRKVVEPCPALIDAFGTATTSSADPTGALIAAVEPSLVACECSADPDTVQTLMWRLVGNPAPTGTVEVTLGAKGKRFSHPAATPWSEIGPTLAAGATLRPAVQK
jgi:biopolymer transport protein ExbD